MVPGEQLPRWALSIYWRATAAGAGGPDAVCRRTRTHHYTSRARPALHQARSRASASTDEHVRSRLRRHLVLPVARAPACRSTSTRTTASSTTSWSACACAACSSRAGQRRRLCATWNATPCLGNGCWRPAPGSCARAGWYLIPGDSPMGYRLPLDSCPGSPRRLTDASRFRLPSAAAAVRATCRAPAVPAQRGGRLAATACAGAKPSAALGTGRTVVGGAPAAGAPLQPPDQATRRDSSATPASQPDPASGWRVTRTAALAEARNGGVLCVFMPPLANLEDYLELRRGHRAELRDTGFRSCSRLCRRAMIPRLKHPAVTPDPASSRSTSTRPTPGASWSNTEFLYEAARLSRLGPRSS